MKYQLQQYNPNDNSSRKIVGECESENPLNPDQSVAWIQSFSSKNDIPEGFTLGVMDENSPLFIKKDEMEALKTFANSTNNGPINDADTKSEHDLTSRNNPTPFIMDFNKTGEIINDEKNRSIANRKARFAQKEEEKKALALLAASVSEQQKQTE